MEGAVAIVLGAGAGERLGGEEPKAFKEVVGHSLLVWATHNAATCQQVRSVIAVVPPGFESRALAELADPKLLTVVVGGESRHDSVRAALEAVPDDAPAIVVHDAARPFATPQLFMAVLEALEDADGAVPVVPVPDTVKRIRGDVVIATEDREELALAQTPQAFRAAAFRDAHQQAAAMGVAYTDDATAAELAGYRVHTVAGEPDNIKITAPGDLPRAEQIATARKGTVFGTLT